MLGLIRALAVILVLAALSLLITEWQPILVHLSQETGTSNSASRAYDFFSGFGSDLGEYAILVAVFNGVYLHWRHINCHAPGCLRIGRYPAAGGQWKLCHVHHPDLMGEKPTLEFIHRRHREHVAANRRAA